MQPQARLGAVLKNQNEPDDMDAREAIPILNQAIAELEGIEPSWKNCRACPHSGKCCDDAFINLIFPEEALAIAEYLKAHPETHSYAKNRAARKKSCYFHDPKASQCLIHEVRPILCRWTPYTAVKPPGGQIAARLRDEECNFTSVSNFNPVVLIRPGFIEIRPAFGIGRSQKMLHLQGLTELHPLLRRAEECVNVDVVMSMALAD
ncbi:YkgJ family cysteine cluster protein [Pseudomonas sp. BLCC-B112]|uniref:YkgJ family cysteine cluster protein n=1 Tax=Pseudomonas sp. BLCC-B112 TaxID=3025319 RepID=UPI003FA6CCB6